ncbi:MAG TPA: hypothetical protein VMS32_06965, partial [Verrucomicrobiae bacterium]|nr:hypothetical protein [Verrucomicrobiae bacterium]
MNRLPSVRIAAVAFACLSLAACGSYVAHPSGWTSTGTSSWSKGGQTYSQTSSAFAGSITDLASQERVDLILGNKGATYDRTDPYPDCPGLGGLMRFLQKTAKPPVAILAAFVVGNSTATVITYMRPVSQAPAP